MEYEATRRETVVRGLALGGLAFTGAAVPSLARVRNAFAQTTTDAGVLSAAIQLEQTAVAVYGAAAASSALDAGTLGVVKLFRSQEQEHADALIAALRQLGGKPPAPPRAPPGAVEGKSAQQILTFAIALEEMAVAAYFDAQQKLKDPKLLQTSASIMANEGQHLVVLRTAADKPPVPNAFETGEK